MSATLPAGDRRRWAGARSAVGRLTTLGERTPLRVKLVATLLALVTIALVLTGIAAATAMRGYLLHRVDVQLKSAGQPYAERVRHDDGVPGFGDRHGGAPPLPSFFYVQVNGADGSLTDEPRRPIGDSDAAPSLPALDAATVDRHDGEPFTVSGTGDDHKWRVLATPLADGSGSVTVALSLADVDSTLTQLILIDVVVSLVVLALLAGVGYALIRSSLR